MVFFSHVGNSLQLTWQIATVLMRFMPKCTNSDPEDTAVRWTCCCGSTVATLPPGTALRAACRLCGARADLIAPRHLDHRLAGPCRSSA